MPELPDVEGYRRFFKRHAAGKKVASTKVRRDILRNSSPQGLGRALRGRHLGEPARHGKWLRCPTDGPILLLHFGMTGDLIWSGDEPERHKHDRLFIGLSGGELRYRNMRKLGGVWLAHDDEEADDIVGPIGPDAYDTSKRDFLQSLNGRRGSIKATLMNQKFVAGLGNLTVDEALWQAHIAPRRSIASLDEGERDLLYRKVRKVLKDSIKVGRVPGKRTWLTGARNRDDPSCPRCRSPLSRTTIGGRTTYWCASCQS
jgi:formamidopyrimidine-DNA glycosylase